MISVFKQEKGANALKKLHAGPASSSGKARVIGGAKRKAKQLEKATQRSGDGVKKIAEKISKFTPGG